jgi:hypothetical protein
MQNYTKSMSLTPSAMLNFNQYLGHILIRMATIANMLLCFFNVNNC